MGHCRHTDSLSDAQRVQENQYEFPYHYIPSWGTTGFSQTQYWSWGFRYLAGIQVALDFLEKLTFASLIDIGCGDGRFLREVFAKYPDKNYLGIDYSEKPVGLATALNPHISYRVIDVTEELPGEVFDVATLIEVIEHIKPHDLPEFLRGVSSTLAPGGRLIVTVPHKNKSLLGKHFQHFDSKSLRTILSSHFKIDEILPFDKHDHVINILFRLLGGKGRRFVVTEKRVLKIFFALYKSRCLYTKSETQCQRLVCLAHKKP